MFRYPLLPTISEPTLSPIKEETEDILLTLVPDVICDCKDITEDIPIAEQKNNNTPYDNEAMDPSEANDSISEEDQMAASGSPEITEADFPRAITVPRNVNDQKRDKEPIRKPEQEVEVLKQKYINNDIQDIPSSSLEGPIRYGRLHRSRSLHVNLASQDIKSQVNKLRIKQRSTNCSTSPRVKFRCSRFTHDSPQHGSKTLEEFLNVDSLNDDYDPELARLFDDNVEECDQVTRGNCIPDTAVLRRLGVMRNSKDSIPNDSATYVAFWRGFAHGMCHSKHHNSDGSNALDHAIKMLDDQREEIQDPHMDKNCQSDMIRTNQNITHRFLKEWEDHQSNKGEGRTGNDSELICFACNTETKMLSDLLEQTPEDGPIAAQSEHNNPTSETKLVVQRDALHLGKSSIALKLTRQDENPKSSKCMNVPTFQSDKSEGSKLDVKKKNWRFQIPTEKNLQFENNDICKTARAAPSTSSKQKIRKGPLDDKGICRSPAIGLSISKDQSRSGNNKPNGPAGPFMIVRKDGSVVTDRSASRSERHSRQERESKDDLVTNGENQTKRKKAIDKLTRIKNALDDTVFKEYHFNDENIDIITLAKMKLENKSMSSLGLDDTLKRKRNLIPRCRSEELERDKEHVMMRKILSNLDLGGWEAKTKPYCEQDTHHMSSSELLHPVDSLESFPSPSLRRQSSSTPFLTSLEKKQQRLKSNEHTPTPSRAMTPERCIFTNAKLSDLDDIATTRRKFETSAFKPNNNVLKSKVTERIKLRLTKSCDSFVEKGGRYRDPAFAKIPLARCQSYNIEKKMKIGLTQASNINLSESLAKQLKKLGKDKDTQKRTTVKVKDFQDDDTVSDDRVNIDDQCNSQPNSSLPLLDGKKLMTLSPRNPQDKQSLRISLPEIGVRNALGNQQPRKESSNENKEVKNHILPPIPCTSLLTSETPLDNVKTATDNHPCKLLSYDEDSEPLINGSFPCRTESLQTPYTYDKADPSKLLLKAKALPFLHTVCTSCGGINEKQENTSGNERPSPRGLFRAGKDKNIHHRCVTPDNEEKWKLEKTRPHSGNELPKVGILKPSGGRKHTKSMKETRVRNTVCSNEYSKNERTKKPLTDEMTFKFLDQNIKLRFEVDLPTEDKRKLIDSISNASDSNSPRISYLAKPRYRDNTDRTISRETNIYKDKIRQKLLLGNGERDRTNSPASSPYLEYCKRKSHLQALKKNKQMEEYIEFNQGLKEESPYQPDKRIKKFPVIQAKTTKQTIKKGSRSLTARDRKSQKGKSENHEDMRSKQLCVEPGKLPTIIIQSPRPEENRRSMKQLTKALDDAGRHIEQRDELLPTLHVRSE